MAQKLSYNFKCNGWTLSMTLNIEMQKPVDGKVAVDWCITGISEGKGTIDLTDGKLHMKDPVKIKPYETGKVKILSSVKVEKFRLMQIKEYCS